MSDNNEESKLMCSVNGCPNRWSINMGRPMCSAHQWSSPNEWGAITAKINGNNLATPSYYEPKDEF
jgi:hypothetical protein